MGLNPGHHNFKGSEGDLGTCWHNFELPDASITILRDLRVIEGHVGTIWELHDVSITILRDLRVIEGHIGTFWNYLMFQYN